MPIRRMRPHCAGWSLRCLFGREIPPAIFASGVEADVSRSPFIKERIDVMYEGDTLPEIYKQTEQVELGGGASRLFL